MGGLSRRAFLATTSSLAVAWGLSTDKLGQALAAPNKPADVPTTLQQTIFQGPVQKGKYRTLSKGPGEPYLPRMDLLGKAPNAARVNARRSIAYLGHMSDIHIMDAQSPARIEPLQGLAPSTFAGAIRPQDTLTAHVEGAMLNAMHAARFSPVTGAPMLALLNTGDSADQHSEIELRWCIDILDGQPVTPNTGEPDLYDGPQVWDEATYAWHPAGGPGNARFGDYGFPEIPNLLDNAVSDTVEAQASPAPWYAVYGNHDTLYYGAFPIESSVESLALGIKKPALPEALIGNYLSGWSQQGAVLGRLESMIRTQLGKETGMRTVASDADRKLFNQKWFMEAHFDTQVNPGPVGHGFTQGNLDTGQTWWSADISSNIRVFGLDTCNQVMGADGAIPKDQFDWLQNELKNCQEQEMLALVMSHHNSLTMENGAVSAIGPSQPLIHAEEFVDMLLQYPCLVGWLNGHTHINTITAHPNKDGTGGFWEITAASCIDYPQQQQLVELVDNRDGTMSIFTTVLDHLSPPEWNPGDFSPQGLASLSRQLSSNDWINDPLLRIGSPYDRNTELLLPAPFDLSKISDASLQTQEASAKARIMAGERNR